MARNWPHLPLYQSREEVERAAPSGWAAYRIEDLFEKLPIGKRFEQKTAFERGSVPVLDQSAEGFVGWHDEEPGVQASPQRPVVTFANHTCEMRLMRRPFSVIQNVFPMVGRAAICDTLYLYYATKGRVHLEEYKGHYPIYRQGWICIPSIDEQIEVAELLGALDDKVELNRRMNATLEAMAQAVFKEWFVDGAKEECEEVTLREACDIFDSKRVPLSNREREKRPGQYPYYGAASVMDHVDDFLFEGIHVLMGEDGSVLNTDGTPVLQYVWGKIWVNNHAHVLTGKGNISTEHLLLALKEVQLAPYVTGAVQMKLNQGNLFKIPFLIPPPDVCKTFNDLIGPLYAKLRANTEESRTLTALRDTLLPKLMRGEVRVKEKTHVSNG